MDKNCITPTQHPFFKKLHPNICKSEKKCQGQEEDKEESDNKTTLDKNKKGTDTIYTHKMVSQLKRKGQKGKYS